MMKLEQIETLEVGQVVIINENFKGEVTKITRYKKTGKFIIQMKNCVKLDGGFCNSGAHWRSENIESIQITR